MRGRSLLLSLVLIAAVVALLAGAPAHGQAPRPSEPGGNAAES
ncbi:MAG TPA: hypothetical protein VE932_17505 [Patescibacteria group bacterium]|nr:hypothetical protein [Patescibacteria group bacterium]